MGVVIEICIQYPGGELECSSLVYCTVLYGTLLAVYNKGGPLCFREDNGSALAVTVTTGACPDAEANRTYMYTLVAIAGHKAG
jgi:hypothetical protein